MIAVFGRKDLGTGILRNMTDGGEGSSGTIVSEETCLLISERRRGKGTGSRPDDWKKNISNGHTQRSPEEIEASNKKRQETRVSRGIVKRKRVKIRKQRSADIGMKISSALKGKPKSPSHIEAMRVAGRNKIFTPEHRRNLSKVNLGKRWYVNEHGERAFSDEHPGAGWTPGMKWKAG
jgi:hypothetical protein